MKKEELHRMCADIALLSQRVELSLKCACGTEMLSSLEGESGNLSTWAYYNGWRSHKGEPYCPQCVRIWKI